MRDNSFWKLLRLGVLNGDTPGLEELCYPAKHEYKGYCTSHKCTIIEVPYKTKRGKDGMRTKRYQQRYVTNDKSLDNCPYCGCAIVWRKIDARRNEKK